MRVITANLNGIRAAARKGFFDWLPEQNTDFVCIQETKAQIDQLSAPEFHPEGYHCYYRDAVKKGYSGTAIYAKREPDNVVDALGWEPCDFEGRYLRADYAKLSVLSVYFPSGTSGDERQAFKYEFLDNILEHFRELKASGREVVICADWNIAHTEKDIKNWRGNKKNSGFLPEERAWLDMLYDEEGWVDAFRTVNDLDEQYTWWSNRGNARANNVGWRLDYQVTTPALAATTQAVSVYTDNWFSDHAPLTMDYDFDY